MTVKTRPADGEYPMDRVELLTPRARLSAVLTTAAAGGPR